MAFLMAATQLDASEIVLALNTIVLPDGGSQTNQGHSEARLATKGSALTKLIRHHKFEIRKFF